MKAIKHRPRTSGSAVVFGWTIRMEVSNYDLTMGDNWPDEWEIDRLRQTAEAKPGDSIFVRGKLRKRYLVFRLEGAQRELKSTGLEIRFNRRTRRWVVFERKLSAPSPEFGSSTIEGIQPRNTGYETLRQAKASVSTSLLERLAAEA